MIRLLHRWYPWSGRTILRITPALLGLFSLVTLLAHERLSAPVRQAAWYVKTTPTLLGVLALVRQDLWAYLTFRMSPLESDMVKVPRTLVVRGCELLSYAA